MKPSDTDGFFIFMTTPSFCIAKSIPSEKENDGGLRMNFPGM